MHKQKKEKDDAATEAAPTKGKAKKKGRRGTQTNGKADVISLYYQQFCDIALDNSAFRSPVRR